MKKVMTLVIVLQFLISFSISVKVWAQFQSYEDLLTLQDKQESDPFSLPEDSFLGSGACDQTGDDQKNYCSLGYLNRRSESKGELEMDSYQEFGVRSFGRNSLYCQNCEQRKLERKLTGNLNQLKRKTEEKWQKRYLEYKTESWVKLLGQTRRQILQMKQSYKGDIKKIENVCGFTDYQKSLSEAIDRIIKNNKGKSGKCSSLTNDPNGQLKKKMLEMIRSSGTAEIESKFNQSNRRDILEVTARIGDVSDDLLLENNKMSAEKYCMYNNTDTKGLELDNIALYNQLSSSLKKKQSAEEFSQRMLLSLHVDPRFDFLLNSGSSGVDSNYLYAHYFKQIYEKVSLSAELSKNFEQKLNKGGPVASAKADLALGTIGDKLTPPDDFVGREKVASKLSQTTPFSILDDFAYHMTEINLEQQCNDLFGSEFETIICQDDELDVSDSQLVLDLDPTLKHCTSANPPDQYVVDCFVFKELTCDQGSKRFSLDERNQRSIISKLHQSVESLDDAKTLRSTHLKEINKRNPLFKSCEDVVDDCIKGKSNTEDHDFGTLIAAAKTSSEKSRLISECRERKWLKIITQRTKNKEELTPQEQSILQDWVVSGNNCDIFQEAEDKETCLGNRRNKIANGQGKKSLGFDGCLTCQDEPLVLDGKSLSRSLAAEKRDVSETIINGKIATVVTETKRNEEPLFQNPAQTNVVAPINSLAPVYASTSKEKYVVSKQKTDDSPLDFEKKFAENSELEKKVKNLRDEIDEMNAKKERDKDKVIVDLKNELEKKKNKVTAYEEVKDEVIPERKTKKVAKEIQKDESSEDNNQTIKNVVTNAIYPIKESGSVSVSQTENEAKLLPVKENGKEINQEKALFIGVDMKVKVVTDQAIMASTKAQLKLNLVDLLDFGKNPEKYLSNPKICTDCLGAKFVRVIFDDGRETYVSLIEKERKREVATEKKLPVEKKNRLKHSQFEYLYEEGKK